ncbi:DUF1254 domain-containing protein [Hyphomicrobium sulfonivorans]|uniref:DUF1254 domain-containing protein n=1 Tax=Hyphomicrobium sulfonivorans TaxID=121290 RepID=UPI0015700571|nr:DUF1254 domain-containing protein [Hyphomicrobium sulfonivorans]MBI1650866.1 DUF1254 domain-containing protein [Hyphomicrobium sulfonivorans]NSL72753.1 hypothetical protein [Hyphomicrobium sulfonivorans]
MKFVGMWALASRTCCAPLATTAIAGATHFEALADAPFVDGRPTAETAAKLQRELAFQQATQAYLWAMPLINTLGMKFGSDAAFGTGYNVLPIWKDRLDPKTLVTTPNSDVIYAMSYVDLSETGPLVFDAPPDMQGILLDFWQRPIPVDGGKYFGDVGFAGPDHGKGGKFLILPPGYDGDVPEGYFVYRSGTNNVFIFLRSFFKDPKNLAPAVELIERAQIYPLNTPQAERKPMQFPNASGVPANMLPRDDFSAFEQIKWLVDREGKHLASADGLGLLANVGLIAGKPFNPDAATKSVLNAAAKTAYKTSRVIGLQDGVAGESYKVWADRQWINPVNNAKYPGPEKALTLPFEYKAGGRVSVGRFSRMLERAVPFKETPPVDGSWSLSIYDKNHLFSPNKLHRHSLGTKNADLKPNDDGSLTLHVSAKPPKDALESNWLPAPDGDFSLYIRAYWGKEPIIDGSWQPPEIATVK